MNMQMPNTIFDRQQSQQFITEMVISVESLGAGQAKEKQAQAKRLLDKLFPLDEGSHSDVTSYVIDYHHIVAYFSDGRHTGLQYPNHFVAYVGDRNEPKQIVFRNGDGCHVEVALGARRGTGCIELVEIADIQLETCTHLNAQASECHATLCIRHWVSLVKCDEKGHPLVCSESKEYHSKGDGDYQLDVSYDEG
ncbi:malate synthase [Vibrio quintilis]|uniref:Malate synthase G n=1 Tax=Vibrio quintilis TaxID=1117707 RepID=A0A1M7YPR4_9VIBR|nr:Malate synthase G [Vibrio quintilis]